MVLIWASQSLFKAGLMTVEMSEFVVVVLMYFLMGAHEGVTGRLCVGPNLRQVVLEVDCRQLPGTTLLTPSFARPTRVLVPLKKSMTDAFYHLRVFELVAGSQLDAVKSLLALGQSFEVH